VPAPTPLPELESYLRQARSDQPNLRADAAIQLGRLRSRDAVKPLIHLLKEDSTPQVREAAARGLALIGAVEALDAVRHAALTDSDRDVRYAASFAAEILQARKGCSPAP
jgi:HEAT repeat protein